MPDFGVIGVGVTGIAETLALLGAHDQTVAPAIAWYDDRGEHELAELERQFGADRFAGLTGLPFSRTPSIVKLRWIMRHVPGAAAARCALSIPEYVACRLGGARNSELSLASRTGLFDVVGAHWATELIDWAGVPSNLFPTAIPAGSPLGTVVSPPDGLQRLRGASIALGGHDHLCAAVGAGVVTPREVLNSCGTAEAYVRSVPPLGRSDLGAAVKKGLCVGCHVVPGYQAILGAGPLGLVLGPIYDLLGWDVEAESGPAGATYDEASDARTAAPAQLSGPEELRHREMVLTFRFDEATGRSSFSGIGPGVRAAQAKLLAADEMLRRSFALFEAVEQLGGPVERVVMTGGWARLEHLERRKNERFPGARVSSPYASRAPAGRRSQRDGQPGSCPVQKRSRLRPPQGLDGTRHHSAVDDPVQLGDERGRLVHRPSPDLAPHDDAARSGPHGGLHERDELGACCRAAASEQDDRYSELGAPGAKQAVVTGMGDLQDVRAQLRGNPATVLRYIHRRLSRGLEARPARP